MDDIDWSARFNALPKNVRIIATAIGEGQRIRDLEANKRRLKANYDRDMREINALIKECRKHVNGLDPA